MQIIWISNSKGRYSAHWEVPLAAVPGSYRFVISAKRYVLTSVQFHLRVGAILTPQLSRGAVRLAYPQPFLLNDWTYRPRFASGGKIAFLVDGKRRTVRRAGSSAFPI